MTKVLQSSDAMERHRVDIGGTGSHTLFSCLELSEVLRALALSYSRISTRSLR